MSLHRHLRAILVPALLLQLLQTSVATAQTPDPQRTIAATDLYEKATAEMDAGKYDSACKKLEEVTRLAPEGVGARLTLGDCYEKLGKLASAWAQYAAAESMATKGGRADRSKTAHAKVAELRPKLATLTISVPNSLRKVEGLAISRDGSSVGDVLWGTAVPVDKGPSTITVTATGRAAWTKKIEINDGDQAIVDVRLGQEDSETSPAKEPPRAPATASVTRPPPPLPPRETREPDAPPAPDASAPAGGWQRPLGITTIVLGGVAGIVTGVVGGLAITRNNASNLGHCTGDRCDDVGLVLRDEAILFGNAATGTFVAASILVVGGILLVATAPTAAPAKDARAPRGTLGLEAGPTGLTIKGRW